MKNRKKFDRLALRLWLLSVVIGAGLTLFAYVAVQQSLRLGLNEPQLQIAEDTAYQLSHGATPASAIPSIPVDESQSLAPFVTIVDSNIHILASSGRIGKIVPLPPASAFPGAQKRGSSWFTWQHDNNKVRDAAVIVPYAQGKRSGYVLVARSMKQTEDIINRVAILAGLTLLGVVLVPMIILLII